MRNVILSFSLALLAACAQPIPEGASTYVVSKGNSAGGDLESFARSINDINRNKTRVEIRDNCYSACTYYLLADDLCIDESITFGFHSAKPWVSVFIMIPIPAVEANQIWARDLESKYPGLGEWFLDEGDVLIGFKHKTAKEMHDTWGVEYCED